MTAPAPDAAGTPGEVILVTGAAGFIGFHLCRRLLADGHRVLGVDNLNSYYDVSLKESRLAELRTWAGFEFRRGDIADEPFVEDTFATARPRIVVQLAAQAGVRYSLENPAAYIEANVTGFLNILQACRHHPVEHLLYASSSSVYGRNTDIPFSETDRTDHPASLYGATKKANELMADCYSHLFGIPATGLRFFTVYGPFGRPDMAYFSFTDNYFADKAIRIFGSDNPADQLSRDFTYVDDVVEAITRLFDRPPTGPVPHQVFNVGNTQPVPLSEFVATLEAALGDALGREVTFRRFYEPMNPGDVRATFAATGRLEAAVGFRPDTSLAEGLRRFAHWYVGYYGLAGR